MPDWLLWLIAGGVLVVAELSTGTLVLAMVAGGAAAGAITAALGGPVALQLLVAIVSTVALLGVVRPVAQRHLAPPGPTATGTDALVGMEAVALTAVDARDGRVRLNGGEWSARSWDDSRTIAAGATVRVVRISGATAYVITDDPPALGSAGAQ